MIGQTGAFDGVAAGTKIAVPKAQGSEMVGLHGEDRA
jgi:hypothetical protein